MYIEKLKYYISNGQEERTDILYKKHLELLFLLKSSYYFLYILISDINWQQNQTINEKKLVSA